MSQFPCGGHTYAAGKLDARSQFHIVRRLSPFLKGLVPIMAKIKASGGDSSEVSPEQGLEVIPELAGILASMDDDTADYIIFGLLKVVTRKELNGLGWSPVSNGNNLMYMDITMAQMITLAGRALVANLGDFFNVLNSALSQLDPKQGNQ